MTTYLFYSTVRQSRKRFLSVADGFGCWSNAETRICGVLQAQKAPISDSCTVEISESRFGVGNCSDPKVQDVVKVIDLIKLFKARGHLVAQLDPLKRARWGPWLLEGQGSYSGEDHLTSLLDAHSSCSSSDECAQRLSEHLQLNQLVMATTLFRVGHAMPGFAASGKLDWSLPAIVDCMRSTYCGTLAVEMKHLFRKDEIAWMTEQVENRPTLSAEVKLGILQHLVRADVLEHFLSQKFPSSKRFGLEGCESVVSGLACLLEACSGTGVGRLVMGMAHRGRLNILVNLMHKSLGLLSSEMEGRQSDFHVGDVKYHLGQSATLQFPSTGNAPPRKLRVSIAPNPSHLEAVNPVVLGMVRGEQALLRDTERKRVMSVHIHGDAALAGLGLVAESLQLSDVPGFKTGGAIHIVINNQVGFTTMPAHGRSSPHPTDVAKIIGAPILHANADDPEAVQHACLIAAAWRAKFGKDVVVDIVGYRRNGHNELEDPRVTLPLTYHLITAHPPVLEIYSKKLQHEGVVSQHQVDELQQDVWQEFEAEFAKADRGEYRESARQFLAASWQGDALQSLTEEIGLSTFHRQEPTGLPLHTLQRVGRAICAAPAHFALHQSVANMLRTRNSMVEGPDSRVDWPMAEALAIGTLLLHWDAKKQKAMSEAVKADLSPRTCSADRHVLETEITERTGNRNGNGTGNGIGNGNGNGTPLGVGLNQGHYNVRLTGQDVERGTFNQRHAVMYDQASGARCVALNNVAQGQQDQLEVWNSPLSEAAVLGFEYGYSLVATESTLVAWEAQFGDFANNAQVMIDQFITSGEDKWKQQSGLVMLMPHGYDGQGPDHSSGRLERFLQLCNDDPDHLPGHSPADQRIIRDTFNAVAKERGGHLTRDEAIKLLSSLGIKGDGQGGTGEVAEVLWAEMGLPEDAHITLSAWESFMVQYIRRNAEQSANMFIVNVTTPAQYFHALRRQMNLPYKKPLLIFTSKFLMHHTPCTSALKDFTTPTFFRRIIDDGKPLDNMRHRSADRETGRPFLLPPEQIQRVILCTGQVFYKLWQQRRARHIRDMVLVRLEQIAPFPHDRVMRVVSQYTSAELVWCQEEPKNMGAWLYVQPRFQTAMRDSFFSQNLDSSTAGGTEGGKGAGCGRRLHYVGRPVSASPATASYLIHRKETQHVLDAALSPDPVCNG